MNQINFKSKAFFYCLIFVFSALLIWNLYLTIFYSNLLGLIPITIQGAILVMIFLRNRYTKIAIKVWALIFLIIGPGLQLVGRLLQDFVDNFANADLNHYLTKSLNLIIGLLLTIYAEQAIEIVELKTEENTIDQNNPIN
ncbi:MAG TPA: hypothetical protein VEV16_10065 [Daejeonella sp.]|nr:hypothetical protein [Daejeonella sp.]